MQTARCVTKGWIVLALLVSANASADWFLDITEAAGVEFQYDNGMTGEYYFAEIMGAGVGLLDYDNDGRLDLYLVQGGALAPDVEPSDRLKKDRLYRNVSQIENGQWQVRFEDVTDASGIDARGYGMGVAVGDYNNDGFDDLYVLNFGENQLWRNNGDGTFSEVTQQSGTAESRWSVSASFVDLYGEGVLDLVVVNYVDYALKTHQACRSATTSKIDYCSPSAYQGITDRLFKNNGDGTFTDVSEASGVSEVARHGLGVITADFNGDGQVELYVANDGSPNSHWIYQGEGRWLDDAFMAGNAVNAGGVMEAGMGVDAGDYNRSGSLSIFITHMRGETNTLYQNQGNGWFMDVTSQAQLGAPSLTATGFGTAWLDIDNDGWLDLVAANGAVVAEESLVAEDDPYPYHQPNQLFRNRGNGRFEEVTQQAGQAMTASLISRGLAVGDLNNDGRPDWVVGNINGPTRLLLNQVDNDHHWVGFDVFDANDQRRLTHTVIWLLDENNRRTRRRHARTDGSYASAQDPRVLFGLGNRDTDVAIEAHWPDGTRERFSGLAVDQYHRLIQGSGEAIGESASTKETP